MVTAPNSDDVIAEFLLPIFLATGAMINAAKQATTAIIVADTGCMLRLAIEYWK
jgi:hypothetical protein